MLRSRRHLAALAVGAAAAVLAALVLAHVATAQTRISRGQKTIIVTPGGAVADGIANDTVPVQSACDGASGRQLYFPKGTYRIRSNMTCGAALLYFEAGAQLAIDAGITFTAAGRVISLGGNPTTGTGAIVYQNAVNMFGNDNGFSFSKTPSVGTDDFFHIRRDVQGSTGIIIRNDDDVGTLTDSYIHLYGGPLTGATQGSNLRFSAGNLANNGGLVNIVAQNTAAFSLINLDSTPIDLYTAGVRQMQLASVPSAVNYWQFKGGLAASSVSLAPAGTDTNISAVYNSKGTGSHFFRTGATPAFQVEIFDTAGAANRVRLTGGANPTITTSGGNLNLASSSGTVTAPILTTTTPIGQASGGTGAGAVTCAAGAFLTSNGTSYSCGTPGAAFIVAAYISSVPTIVSQTGSVTLGAVSHGTAGHYQVVIPGLTASAIVVGSGDVAASPGMMFTSTPAAGTLTVHMVNGANADSDSNFSFIVVKL